MKRLLQSEFFSKYGTLVVLLLLLAYYGIITVDVQNPITPGAGRSLAREIVAEHGEDANVIILVRDIDGDKPFAEALKDELVRQDANIVDLVHLKSQPGYSRNAAITLDSVGESKIHAIVTHDPGTSWGPLKESKLKERGTAFAETKVHKPASYTWPTFLTSGNLLNIVNSNAEIFIVAIGMTMVIITAGIDLSVGSMLALSGVLTAVMIQSAGGAEASIFAIIFCALMGMAICTLCGTFSGTMITVFRIPAFIVTLALMMIARGLAYIINVRYNSMLSGGTGAPVAIKIEAEAFSWLGKGEFLYIPNPILLTAFLLIAAHIVMTRTSFGRYVYAVGGNPEAAKLSGIRVGLVLTLVYTICGALTGLAGILNASRFESGNPADGNLYELQVIAAVVVGGTSLAGGEGRIIGTLIGAMIIAVIENGLNMAGVDKYEQQVVFGLLILAAALVDQLKKRTGKT